ncbi:hypothetical protein VTI28DRAFT_5917 [Corynascus sepedonium]
MSAPNSGSRSTPSGPGADFSSTPTGPAASNDRMRSGGRQLRGIQNTLDKASADNARGPGLRSSRSRPNLAGSDAQILVGASPVTTPVHERPPESFRDSSRREPSDRPPRSGPDPIQVVSDTRDGREISGGRGSANGDDYGSSRTEHDRSRREHHRSERGTRPSGRSSRDRTPDREREPKDSREYRERRSSNVPGSSTRDDRESRRSMRESTGGGRESIPGGGRDLAPPRESSSHRSHRGEAGQRGDGSSGGGRGEGGRTEDYGRSGSSRGGGPPRDSRSSRPGDERGDPRGGEDRARKRRSEGVDVGSGSHQDKRQRR